jgi:hypothetical protein
LRCRGHDVNAPLAGKRSDIANCAAEQLLEPVSIYAALI